MFDATCLFSTQRAMYHPTPTQLREIELDRDLHVKRQLDGACAEGSSAIFSFYRLLISSSVHQKCDLAQIACPAPPGSHLSIASRCAGKPIYCARTLSCLAQLRVTRWRDSWWAADYTMRRTSKSTW